MFIFKNAFISIARNKGRNILIGLIILVIACASTITLAINNTASDLISSYKSAYDKELTITFDRKNMMKDVDFSNESSRESVKEKFDNISSYTIDDIKKFADSNYIKSYYYTYNISLNGDSIKKAENSSSEGNRPNFSNRGGNTSSYDFTLNGYSSLEAMSEFVEGTYEMVEIADDAWDIAFDGNYVFINEELASYNKLKLGDTIKLKDDDNKMYEFKIIGIYKENESNSEGPRDMFANSVNTIITNADSLVAIAKSNSNIKGMIKPTFIIDDYKNADKIKDEFYKKGLDSNYTVQTNEDIANAGVSSIQNVKSFATTFLIITLLIGGIVLFVINMINIRERKYEIGVLRTVGISKTKLTMQFVFELLMVGVLALIIGAGIGATMSKSVSNSLLSNEINNTEVSNEKMRNNFGGPGGGDFDKSSSKGFGRHGVPSVQAYDSINAVVDIGVLFELLGIGLTLILVSSLSAMISIQRFSPLTILKERS